jgi:beta-ureidopropionase / N-carbamoyl-L-amino-acid hydrolase
MRADFDALAQIGATGNGGVDRPSLSPAHLEARAWLRSCIIDSGLEFRSDGAGNHSAYLPCGSQGAPILLLGSHLDSVPSGGRFDGPLGVLAALEALRVVKEQGLSLPFHLEAIDFTDEEGTLVGELGSGALAGTLALKALDSPRGGRQALEAGLQRAGLTEAGIFSAQRDPTGLAGYLELHIEQGLRLMNVQAQIGIVTSIVGISSYRLAFLGQAGHAGTTPMEDRHDAGLAASVFNLAARELVMREFPGCVANVGQIHFSPGAFNIIPARADLALEFRAPDAPILDRLEGALLARARDAAQQFRLELIYEQLDRVLPAEMAPVFQAAIREAAGQLGLKAIPLASFAGHDAQALAPVCPVGMLFVPSVGGISHSPRELTHWEDCVYGANTLLNAVIRLGGKNIKTE